MCIYIYTYAREHLAALPGPGQGRQQPGSFPGDAPQVVLAPTALAGRVLVVAGDMSM